MILGSAICNCCYKSEFLFQDLDTLQKKIVSVSVVSKSSVNSVLDLVRQLASRTSALVDPYALAALQIVAYALLSWNN